MLTVKTLQRSMILAALLTFGIYSFVYLYACHKVYLKMPGYDYVTESILVLMLVQIAVFLSQLLFTLRLNRKKPIKFNSEAVKRFGQTHAVYLIAPFLIEIALKIISDLVPLSSLLVSRIVNFSFFMGFTYVLFRGQSALYEFLVKSIDAKSG